MTRLSDEILEAVTAAIGPASEPVPLHRPFLPPATWKYVKACLDSGWVSSGSSVSEFENLLAHTTGCQRVVAAVNGTAALEICFRIVGVLPGDEVFCPSLTYVSTANAISHCGATPHFVDISKDRLSICPEALQNRLAEIVKPSPSGPMNRLTGNRLGAVCLMHCFGHPGDLDPIVAICDRYELPLVEDAAESLGSFYKVKHTGRFGRVAAMSFNGNKIVTTGGGGAIFTDDDNLADRAKHLTNNAKVSHPTELRHDEIGWNYRLPNINAALGIAQLEMLDVLLKAKRALAMKYLEMFQNIDRVRFIKEPVDSESNYWLNGVIIDDCDKTELTSTIGTLAVAGFQCRPAWEPMHKLPMYSACPRGSLTLTNSIHDQILCIPSSANLSPDWNKLTEKLSGTKL